MPKEKLPQISGKELIAILEKRGFHIKSQKGSHIKLEGFAGNLKTIVIIPNHKILKKGTLHDILKFTETSIEQLKELL